VRLVWRAAPGWTALNMALAVLQGVVPLFAVCLMKLIVDAVTTGASAADHAAAFRTAALYIALAAAVGLAAALLRSLATLTSEALAQIVTNHMSDPIHSKSIVVDLEYYEDPAYYDTLQRAVNEAPSRPTKIVSDLLITGQSAISMIAMAALLFTLHWSVGLIVLLAAHPGAGVRMRYSRRVCRWQLERTETERRSWYAHWLLTSGPTQRRLGSSVSANSFARCSVTCAPSCAGSASASRGGALSPNSAAQRRPSSPHSAPSDISPGRQSTAPSASDPW